MKIKTLLFTKSRQWAAILVALLIGGQVIAQNVIESWDFEGEEAIPAGFVNIDVDQTAPVNAAWSGDQGASQWILAGQPKPDNGANLAVSATSWLDPLGMSDDWLITPGIDLSTSSTVFLSLNFSIQQNDWPDGFRVLLGTGNDISDFPDANEVFSVGSGCFNNPGSVVFDDFWMCNCDPTCPEDFAVDWGNVLVDVSSFAGQEVFVAIHHNANDQTAIFIDDITLFEPVANEASIVAAPVPAPFAIGPASVLNDALDFNVTVSNNGSAALSNVRLSVLVEEISDVANPVTVMELDGMADAAASIPPSSTMVIENNDAFSFVDEGLYFITYTVIADEGDADESNNTAGFPYMVSETILGQAAVFPDPTDPDGPPIAFFPDGVGLGLWTGNDGTTTEGLFGSYFSVSEELSMSGAAFDVGFDDTNGVGYDPGTEIQIVLIDTTGSAGDRTLWTSEPHLVSTTGPLTGLTPNVLSEAFWSCPIDLQPGINYLLAYMKVGPGDGGFVASPLYFNSGTVLADPELSDGAGLLPQGQPVIHALFGASQPLTSVMAAADPSSLTVDFSADVVGTACDYAWDFGDGNTGTGPFPSNTYASEGDFTVCVTASNPDGDEMENCIDITVACAIMVAEGEVTPSTIEVIASNGSGDFTYLWSDGQTSATAVDLDPGAELTVTVTDAAGCSTDFTASTSSCALSLSVTVIDQGSVLAATDGNTGDITFTYVNTDTGETFDSDQAFQDGLAGGTWDVTVTDAANCTASTTVFLDTGIEDIAGVTDFSMLPNPSSDFVNLSLNLESNAAVSIAIYTIDGQQVRQVTNGNVIQVNETIDLGGLSSGLYLVKIAVDNDVVAEKLIIE